MSNQQYNYRIRTAQRIRAIAGGDALQYFAFEHGERTAKSAHGLTYADPQSGATTDLRLQNLADLLSNLAHYCDDDGLDFGTLWRAQP